MELSVTEKAAQVKENEIQAFSGHCHVAGPSRPSTGSGLESDTSSWIAEGVTKWQQEAKEREFRYQLSCGSANVNQNLKPPLPQQSHALKMAPPVLQSPLPLPSPVAVPSPLFPDSLIEVPVDKKKSVNLLKKLKKERYRKRKKEALKELKQRLQQEKDAAKSAEKAKSDASTSGIVNENGIPFKCPRLDDHRDKMELSNGSKNKDDGTCGELLILDHPGIIDI